MYLVTVEGWGKGKFAQGVDGIESLVYRAFRSKKKKAPALQATLCQRLPLKKLNLFSSFSGVTFFCFVLIFCLQNTTWCLKKYSQLEHRKPLYTSRNYAQPSHRAQRSFSFDTVFNMAWCKIVLQRFLVIYHGISLVTCIFLVYTREFYTLRPVRYSVALLVCICIYLCYSLDIF